MGQEGTDAEVKKQKAGSSMRQQEMMLSTLLAIFSCFWSSGYDFDSLALTMLQGAALVYILIVEVLYVNLTFLELKLDAKLCWNFMLQVSVALVGKLN
ncbi:hypothetical protein REPUB_Repub05bG0080800 [Reevesia pubescens]